MARLDSDVARLNRTPVAGEDAGAVGHFQGGSLPTDARLRRVLQGAGHPTDQARRLVRGARCPGPAGGIPRFRINRCAVNPSEVAVLAAFRLEAIEFCEWLEWIANSRHAAA